MKAISITAMIFAVAVAFAVGWLTGSHAGYTAGAESEHVLIDARATLPEAAPPVAIVEPVRSTQPAPGTWRTIVLPVLPVLPVRMRPASRVTTLPLPRSIWPARLSA